ncbi:hypothetical protein GCM10023339_22730 [Alloalcanivorax gelatiniphagus]
MHRVPDAFRVGVFHRAAARDAGIPARVLEGVQFVRVHKGVYHHRGHVLTFQDRIQAARLVLPDTALTTGITRIQEAGVDLGSRRVLHFVVEGDLHLTLDGVFLHRTVMLPPADGRGVTLEAAFVACCAELRVIDAIKVGSLLASCHQLSIDRLERLVTDQPWRRGCVEARWVLPHLDDRCRSLPEAEVLALVRFAGLPECDVNCRVEIGPGIVLTPDLWFAAYRRAVEYEGSHHQEERAQYNADIDRYAAYRKYDADYVQVTKERLRSPRATARSIHALLVEGGYHGPPPDFGATWALLFQRLAEVVRPLKVP